MSKSIKYYYDFLSQPSRAMWIIMKLSNAPFEEMPVSIKDGDLKTNEYRDVNRFQRVPCIVNGNFKLAESIAILRYLDGLGLISEKLYPKDIEKRARVDEYLEWQHHNTRLNGFMYFQHQLRPFLLGKDIISERLEKLEGHVQRTMDNIENIWLKSTRFLTSDDHITVADIFAACEIEQPIIAGLDPFKNRPKLKEFMGKVKKEANPFYKTAHSDCEKLKEFILQAKL